VGFAAVAIPVRVERQDVFMINLRMLNLDGHIMIGSHNIFVFLESKPFSVILPLTMKKCAVVEYACITETLLFTKDMANGLILSFDN
jgi:hypothetical protein